jgi:hypothetical protein
MHTIRLRGPWQMQPMERFAVLPDDRISASGEDLPTPTVAKMPDDWSSVFGADFLGRVRYVRTFNKPTGLDSGERVFLVVEPPISVGRVAVNGQILGEVRWGAPPGRFDITTALKDHNAVEVEVSHPAVDGEGKATLETTSVSGGLLGEVRLEIED